MVAGNACAGKRLSRQVGGYGTDGRENGRKESGYGPSGGLRGDAGWAGLGLGVVSK